jgi:putative ABC transport system permease protein
LSQAQAEMDVIARRLQQQYPRTNTGWGVKLVRLPGQDQDSDEIIRSFLGILMGAAGFVLLIACANVANLQLARAIGRQKEIALRCALGATRWRIVRQLLTESVMLSFLAAAVGALLAGWGVSLIRTSIPPDQLKYVPGFQQMHLNGRGLEFTLVIALLTGILSGLAPAARTSRPDLDKALKEGGRRSTGGARSLRLRSFLAVCEVALALILLVGTGSMVNGFVYLFKNPQKDFDPKNLLTMRVALPKARYQARHQRATFYEQALEGIRTLPKVESVAVVSYLPLSGDWYTESFTIEGRVTTAPGEARVADVESVSESYFRTMRIPVIKGREFTSQDGEGTTPVAIISQNMARQFWPGETPLGRRIKLGRPASDHPWLTIVGIVGDVKQFVLDREPRLTVYTPYVQSPPAAMSLVIRDSSSPLSLVPSVRAQVLGVNGDQPIYSVKSMEEVIDDSVAGVGIAAALMGSFGIVALILSAVGIYSVIAYSVSQRTHEIGVRMALGAQHPDILRLIVFQALKLGMMGLATGLPGAFVLSRVMSSMLFGVIATDPSTFVSFGLLLLATALLSGYVPALRATKVDPMEALRGE